MYFLLPFTVIRDRRETDAAILSELYSKISSKVNTVLFYNAKNTVAVCTVKCRVQ